jgi:hypothetical protein
VKDIPEEPGSAGFSLNANGPAWTSRQNRSGVPLDYVAEKLNNAIEQLHDLGQQHPDARDAAVPAMYFMLVAYLGLNNMLGGANDRKLASRLLSGNTKKLREWLDLVAREGDVYGLASLDSDVGPSVTP